MRKNKQARGFDGMWVYIFVSWNEMFMELVYFWCVISTLALKLSLLLMNFRFETCSAVIAACVCVICIFFCLIMISCRFASTLHSLNMSSQWDYTGWLWEIHLPSWIRGELNPYITNANTGFSYPDRICAWSEISEVSKLPPFMSVTSVPQMKIDCPVGRVLSTLFLSKLTSFPTACLIRYTGHHLNMLELFCMKN